MLIAVDALQQMVSVCLLLGDHQLATGECGRGTALRPQDAQSFLETATVAMSVGDTSAALIAFGTCTRASAGAAPTGGAAQALRRRRRPLLCGGWASPDRERGYGISVPHDVACIWGA